MGTLTVREAWDALARAETEALGDHLTFASIEPILNALASGVRGEGMTPQQEKVDAQPAPATPEDSRLTSLECFIVASILGDVDEEENGAEFKATCSHISRVAALAANRRGLAAPATVTPPEERQQALLWRVENLLRRSRLSYSARFEEDAERFYRETGWMAPGKSVAPAMASSQPDERRRAAWEAWCAAEKIDFENILEHVLAALPRSGVRGPQEWHPIADFTQSFDARDWARAFVGYVTANPSIATDEGTMIGWFANAIMRGHDGHFAKCQCGGNNLGNYILDSRDEVG